MSKDKMIIAAGIALAVIIAIIIAGSKWREKKYEGYVFDRTSKIGTKDVKIYLSPGDFNADDMKNYFKNEAVNSYTMRYFLFLDYKFKNSKSIDDLLRKVRDHLYKIMSSYDQADKLFAVYRTYTHYQQKVFDKMKSWGKPSTPLQAIEYLHKIQEYRREVFGRETADALFGPSVMIEEYPIRRAMIVNSADEYGAEKEIKLDELKKNMWGEDADSIDSLNDPLNRYHEKLKIYQKDLAEMNSDEERHAKIRQFRELLFTPEQARRLEEVDRLNAAEKKKEEDYFSLENEINNDRSLDAEGKAQRIRRIQDQVFGNEAEAFRRRLVFKNESERPRR